MVYNEINKKQEYPGATNAWFRRVLSLLKTFALGRVMKINANGDTIMKPKAMESTAKEVPL